MTGRLTASLREAPATVPALAAVALFIVWSADQAGYPLTHWAPGTLIILGLLAIAVAIVGLRPGEIPLPTRIALAAFAAFTALSFLSIRWAGVPGDAWEGANRSLLYLLVFALFACWPQRGATAALLLATWTLAMIGLAAFAALHLDTASRASLPELLPFGRLTYPSDYANANAAQWLMAFWPAFLLARSGRLPWALRGVLAGGAVLLAEVALLSQSRGSFYATPVMLVLVFALLPGRARTFALLVPVAAAIGAAAPAVLRVGDHLRDDAVVPATLHKALTATLVAALVVAVVVAVAAAIEDRMALPHASATRIRRGVGVVAIATLAAVLAGGWVAAGDPLGRAHHAWETFKSGRGYAANSAGSRLTSGLGSNRYDFYRVSLDEFADHPLVGIGADNFQQQYLLHRRSDETPRYPHSVELRTLVQTGLVGALLALVGLGAALLAAGRALRGRPPGDPDSLGSFVVAAALGGFAYWAVHGSVDWFWEFAGLGAPAFAMLGLACALAPRALPPAAPASAPASRDAAATRRRALVPRLGVAGSVLLAVAVALSMVAPWLSRLQIQSAARVWRTTPQTAYADLNDAARLNPLSDEALLVAGNIAVRLGDLGRADHEFARALDRVPRDAYATLERGAIASTRGERRRALSLLERAVQLNPRDPLAREALLLERAGRRVSVQRLNLAILTQGRQLS
jgi:tetratricopeptide (TPR) repeat protein